jgi:signal transduction histidine kinase
MVQKLEKLLDKYKNTGLEDTHTRRSRLLNILLFATAACAVLGLVFLLIAVALGKAGDPQEVWLMGIAILFTSIGIALIYSINRYGSSVLASILYLILLIAIIAISDEPYHIVDGRGLLMFAIPILTASVLLKPWASFAAAAACSIVIAFMGIVLAQQAFPNIPGMLGFFLLAVVSWISASSLEQAMQKLKASNRRLLESEQQLKVYQMELENQVEFRTQELKHAQEKIIRQERLTVLGKLAGSVAHELRNPLGVITNAIYYLKFTLEKANQKEKDYLELIETEAHVAAGIISDLLDFAQPKKTHPSPISVSTLIEAAITRQPPPGNIELKLDIPQDLPNLNIDLSQISLALDQLLTNAYQAMPQGGRLSLICQQDSKNIPKESERWVNISVQDTGYGIPVENLPILFEPLFTTKTNGIGLGLPISKKMVELNGGEISAESEPGVGSSFCMKLPTISNQLDTKTSRGEYD